MIDKITPISEVGLTELGQSRVIIPIEGSASPETYRDLMNIIKDFLKNNYEPNTNRYTQNAVTLYTPSANYTKYYIRKRYDNNKYSIIWYNTVSSLNPSSETKLLFKEGNTTSGISYGAYNIQASYPYDSVNTTFSKGYIGGNNNEPSYYYSLQYDTLSDAINAIQSSSTTYTAWVGSGITDMENYLGYSNIPLVNRSGVWYQLPKISDNETIEVIS